MGRRVGLSHRDGRRAGIVLVVRPRIPAVVAVVVLDRAALADVGEEAPRLSAGLTEAIRHVGKCGSYSNSSREKRV